MAGAGFKDFGVGEVLTASDVDTYLMQQSVMRFADAAARGTALGTATGAGTALAEGMVSYLDDLNVVEVYTGSGWRAPGAGIGANVVQAVKTDTFTMSGTAYTDVTDLEVTITPTSASSKVLLLAQVSLSVGTTNDDNAYIRFSGGNTSGFVGDAAGSRVQAAAETGSSTSAFKAAEAAQGRPLIYVDSPATTSAVTYKVQLRQRLARPAYINRSGRDTDSDTHGRTASSIIAIEVAA